MKNEREIVPNPNVVFVTVRDEPKVPALLVRLETIIKVIVWVAMIGVSLVVTGIAIGHYLL